MVLMMLRMLLMQRMIYRMCVCLFAAWMMVTMVVMTVVSNTTERGPRQGLLLAMDSGSKGVDPDFLLLHG